MQLKQIRKTMILTGNLKKNSTVLIFLLCAVLCHAQFDPIMGNPTDQRIIYTIKKTAGEEKNIYNAGNVLAVFHFDSIGKYWNTPTENDYLRFKILHFYILGGRKEGEHWKEMYNLSKKGLNEKFNDYMKSRLKKKSFKVSTKFYDAAYLLNVYFIDKSENVQHEKYYVVFQFIDRQTGAVVLQYRIEEVEKGFLKPSGKIPPKKYFSDPCIAMSNYFRKHLK